MKIEKSNSNPQEKKSPRIPGSKPTSPLTIHNMDIDKSPPSRPSTSSTKSPQEEHEPPPPSTIDEEKAEKALPPHPKRPQSTRSLRTTRSHQSRAGGDGYTCFDAEPVDKTHSRAQDANANGGVAEQPYLVTWDGDADPENPRSMTKLRRWGIVLICAASSLCV